MTPSSVTFLFIFSFGPVAYGNMVKILIDAGCLVCLFFQLSPPSLGLPNSSLHVFLENLLNLDSEEKKNTITYDKGLVCVSMMGVVGFNQRMSKMSCCFGKG